MFLLVLTVIITTTSAVETCAEGYKTIFNKACAGHKELDRFDPGFGFDGALTHCRSRCESDATCTSFEYYRTLTVESDISFYTILCQLFTSCTETFSKTANNANGWFNLYIKDPTVTCNSLAPASAPSTSSTGGTSTKNAVEKKGIMKDSSLNNYKCGESNTRNNENRIFDLRENSVTIQKCAEKCLEIDSCIAFSGIFTGSVSGKWCIGCKSTLTYTHSNAKAFTKYEKKNALGYESSSFTRECGGPACSDDDYCKGSLKCYQRTKDSDTVPGCFSNTALKIGGYCYDPNKDLKNVYSNSPSSTSAETYPTYPNANALPPSTCTTDEETEMNECRKKLIKTLSYTHSNTCPYIQSLVACYPSCMCNNTATIMAIKNLQHTIEEKGIKSCSLTCTKEFGNCDYCYYFFFLFLILFCRLFVLCKTKSKNAANKALSIRNATENTPTVTIAMQPMQPMQPMNPMQQQQQQYLTKAQHGAAIQVVQPMVVQPMMSVQPTTVMSVQPVQPVYNQQYNQQSQSAIPIFTPM